MNGYKYASAFKEIVVGKRKSNAKCTASEDKVVSTFHYRRILTYCKKK